MKKMTTFFAVTLLLSTPALALAQEVESGDEATVRQVVQHFVDGQLRNDSEGITKAVHRNARLFSYTNQACPGKKSDLSSITGQKFATYRERLDGRPMARRVTTKIVLLDLVGDTAVVKAESYWPDAWWFCGKVSLVDPAPGVTDTEYFSLIRLDAGWKIVARVSSTREGR